MKTKAWILLLAVVLIACIGLSIPVLLPGKSAEQARIVSNGTTLHLVDLGADRVFQIDTPEGGSNTITVKNGKIAVTHANCPDHYCMERGYCNSGSPIVCLPNRLVIEFIGETEVDGIVG